MTIPNSADGEVPQGSDPSAGKSYKRWILFWKHFRKKHNAGYKKLVKGVLDVLEGSAPNITRIKFSAVEDASAKADSKDYGSERRITLYTAVWHKVVAEQTSTKKRKYSRRR